MKQKTRQRVFLLFIMAFLVITPLITLYAVGYKINFKQPFSKKMLQKTGMFIFESEPNGADIYIDGKIQTNFLSNITKKETTIQTPAKIKGLMPGEYNVKLEIQGYWPWQKKLKIEPGQSTFVENIYLFKNSLPLKIIDSTIDSEIISIGQKKSILESPHKKYLAVLQEKNLLIINQNTEEIFTIEIDDTDNLNLLWSSDGSKLLMGYTLIEFNDVLKIKELKKLKNDNAQQIKWETNNPNLLFYKTSNSIRSFNLKKEKITELAHGDNYVDYLIKNNFLFLIIKTNIPGSLPSEHKKIKIKTINLEENTIVNEIELPFSNKYLFKNYEHDLLSIYDQKNKMLYIINPFNYMSPLQEVFANLEGAQWMNDRKLLHYNNHEIWISDLSNGSREIILRGSDSIKNILYHSNWNYIIYSTNKSINAVGLDDVKKRITTNLISLESISSPSLNKKQNTLYFNAKIGNQEGLYKLFIH